MRFPRRPSKSQPKARAPGDTQPGGGERFAEIRSLRDGGRFVEAERLVRAHVGAHPQDAGGHAELGLVQLHAGRATDALPSLLRAVRLSPQVGLYHEAAGCALEALGRDGEAITAYRTAIARDPRLPTAHERLGNLLVSTDRRADATDFYRSAAKTGDPSRRVSNLAMALRLEGEADEAAALLTQAIESDGDTPVNRLALAGILRERGRFAEALVHLEAATEGTPGEAAAAYLAIVQSKRITEEDRALLAPLQALIAYRPIAETVHHSAEFALGKAYDDLGEYEAAMRHYDAGNAIVARRRPFDRSQSGASVSRVIATAGSDFFAAHSGSGNPSQLPVLIVGMPRSGTTLVEQILSSHREVAGGDELLFWTRAARGFGQLKDDSAIRDWLARTAAEYIEELRLLGPHAQRVTDKMPANFLWLGLYHLALPRARIIHCRRNPVDTCLSNYFTLFLTQMTFSYDKGDLAFYYRAYRRIMAHWREVLPREVMLEIDYEELVADPEPVTRRMIDFLGLDWDPACLRPEDNRRAVRTASQWQVRQRTYRDSVERWRRYEPWLGELLTLLDENDSDGPVHPQSGNAAIASARALSEEGRIDEAIAAVQEALRADLRDPVLFSELGTLFLRAGRAEDACESLWRAIGLDPNFAVAHYNLGAALERLGDPAGAVASLRRSVTLDPKLGAAYSRLGNLLQARGEVLQAEESFRRARDLLAAPADQELEEAKLLRVQARHDEAEGRLRRVLELDPRNALAYAMMGDSLGESGRFDEAIAHFRKAYSLDSNLVSALYNVMNLGRVTPQNLDLVAEMEILLARPRRVVAQTALLHFALGKAYDDLGDEAKAIVHFDAANALERRYHRFDRDTFAARIDALIAAPLPESLPTSGSDRALFIIGMPRSGTTLAEQILSAHPDIGAGGELTFWVDAAEAAKPATAALAAEYLGMLERLAPGAERVTDKNPFCFLALPLIRAALPAARIIHCRRDPIDTCLSIYFTRFAKPLPFSYDRDDLAFYYRHYLRLMAHWRDALPPERFLEVDYEALTAAPEAESRRLIAFAGLPWDGRCLAPEANPRPIRTASLWQARQPIYRASTSRRQRYARWLGALALLASSEGATG